MIGIRFSRASAKAVASITLRFLLDRLLMAQAVIALGGRVALWVGAIDTVDIGGLQHRIAFELAGAQDRGRVGREMRIAGPAGQHHDPALREMLARALAGIGFADLRSEYRRQRRAQARRCARSRLPAQGRSSRSQACPSCRRSGATRRARRPRRREKYCRRRPQRQSRRRALRGDEIGSDAFDGRLIDSGACAAGQRLTGQL